MRKLLYLLLVTLPVNSYALEVRFTGPCLEAPLFASKTEPYQISVGELTLKVLDENGIKYQGTSAGLNQVFNTPIGLEAMEVISDEEMFAYGWYYEVDGKFPEVFPSEILVTNTMKSIHWFYGYAHYLKGNWISQCEKSYKRHSSFLCPSN